MSRLDADPAMASTSSACAELTDRQIIDMNVIWNRLISVCEEQANALLRLAFGAIVREAGDLSAGVFDAHGNMLAQAVTGTPGHVNTMAESVGLMLERIPANTLRAGDVLTTNDPWIGAGHIFDFVVVTPVFHRGTLIGFMASTSHIVDVGGLGWTAEARSVREEGVLIPVSRLRKAGQVNEDLLGIVAANSRLPNEARGDILSLMSCNDTGAERLVALMTEFDVSRLDAIADFIFTRSRRATAEAIRQLPNGEFENRMVLDGYDRPLELHAVMRIDGEVITTDLSGSSPAVDRGINCPFNYTMAYGAFGLKVAVAPNVPNNAASLQAIRFTAPPNLVVSAQYPSPVSARHVVGQALPDLMLGCLAKALPGQILAESAGALWTISLSGLGEHRFSSLNVALGGMGARPASDGLSTTAFPSGVGAVPVEMAEHAAPLIYHSKEFVMDSGGDGQYRGGLGQRLRIGSRYAEPMALSAAAFERLVHGAAGREGGGAGAPGRVHITDGTDIQNKGRYVVPAGESVVLETPGGGGFGSPQRRDPEARARDRRHGLVSETSDETDTSRNQR